MFPGMPMHKPRHIFRNESGAFDLPSIMIGVAVVAILTVGVLAAIFGVIPWSQDKAAQQDLGAVHTAQGAAFAKDGGFKSRVGLASAGFLVDDPDDGLDIRASSDGRKYVGVSTSATGKKFMISAEAPTSRPLTNQDKWPEGEVIDPNAPDAPDIEAGPTDSNTILATHTCGPAELVITQAMQDHSDRNQALKDAGKADEMLAYPGGEWKIALDASVLSGPGSEGVILTADGEVGSLPANIRNDRGFGLVSINAGQCSAMRMNSAGQPSSLEGPAGVNSVEPGTYQISYYVDGVQTNKEGPALVIYESDEITYRAFIIDNTPISTYEAWVSAGGVPEAWVD